MFYNYYVRFVKLNKVDILFYHDTRNFLSFRNNLFVCLLKNEMKVGHKNTYCSVSIGKILSNIGILSAVCDILATVMQTGMKSSVSSQLLNSGDRANGLV